MDWQQDGSLYYYINDLIQDKKKLISFDLDWTLTYSEEHLFPRNATDIHLMPRRQKKLQYLHDKGWGFVIFTNQFSKNDREAVQKMERIETFINNFTLPLSVFIATKKDSNRKPNIGMYTKARKLINGKIRMFVGDAAGRQQDFADSDKQFAENAKIKFLIPERVFQPKIPELSSVGKQMVVFVGMPGSGKSSFYTEHLEYKKYVQVNQDILKTAARVKSKIISVLESGQRVCIDLTNPSQDKRQVFYDMACEYEYNVSVVYFIRDGRGWNNLREHPVPDIAYHMYFKKLVPPDRNNTPGMVYKIT
jgi:bifunctional polynucleotide phosphatase/kinase